MAAGMAISWLPFPHRKTLVFPKKDTDAIGCLIAFLREEIVLGGVDGHSWIEFRIADERAGV
jgi:hypothetical protein